MTRPRPQQESATARVLREDVLLFINGCFAATGQSGFYRGASEQALSMDFVHQYMLHNYRRIYTLCLAVGINDYNSATVIFNLLAFPAGGDFRHRENALIRQALQRMPPQRVYRLFSNLRRCRVNNRRTRAVVRDYLQGRGRWEFDAMKYRRGLGDAARHTHLPLSSMVSSEIGPFLFGWKAQKRFDSPTLEAWRAAHYSQDAVYQLPYTVAEGFAARHAIPRDKFLKRIAPRMTKAERERLSRSASREGVDLKADLSRMPLLRLAALTLSLAKGERIEREEELVTAFRGAARRASRNAPAVLSNFMGTPRVDNGGAKVVAVLDDSYSASGARDGRNRPLAVALGTHYLLESAFPHYQPIWLRSAEKVPIHVRAVGQTRVADALVAGLRTNPDVMIVVSDGWENDPPGAAHAVIDLYRRDLDREGRCLWVHANPVFDAAAYQPRALSPLIPTVGIRTPEDVLTVLPFARFACGGQSAEELEAFLEQRADAFCRGNDG